MGPGEEEEEEEAAGFISRSSTVGRSDLVGVGGASAGLGDLSRFLGEAFLAAEEGEGEAGALHQSPPNLVYSDRCMI